MAKIKPSQLSVKNSLQKMIAAIYTLQDMVANQKNYTRSTN